MKKYTPVKRFELLLNTRKKGHLTNELYDLLYIYSNVFIAHFNKDGFYEARIKDDGGFVDTVESLSGMKYKVVKNNQDKQVNSLIRIARKYSKKNSSLISDLALVSCIDLMVEEASK